MSTFQYKSEYGEALNGVKCDACGFKLYTHTSGQEFGEHMRTAKENGWLIAKEGGEWLNLCPKCKETREERKRAEWFSKHTSGAKMEVQDADND